MQSDGSGYAAVRCPSCGAPLQSDAETQVCAFCQTRVSRPGSLGEGAGAPARPHSSLIETIRFRSESLPQGWVELQFAYATAEQCEKFGQSLHGGLHALGNQFINANAGKLQINYVHAVSLDAAKSVYDSMVKMVGKSNSVARKGEIVAEIICENASTTAWVLGILAPDDVHRPRWSR